MKTYTIDFYDRFQCIASDCPYTCCKGWGLIVDDDTYYAMRKEKGLLGIKLRLFTRIDENNGAVLRTVCGSCPFLEKDGLCRLQKEKRKELIADVCNLYPRRSVSYGEFCEVTLELSCIHAATLFLQDVRRHAFIERNTEGGTDKEEGKNWLDAAKTQPYYAAMNQDTAFLSHLMEDRERILDYLWDDGMDIFGKMAEILDYARTKQDYFSRDDRIRAEQVPLPVEKKEAGGSKSRGTPVFSVADLNGLIFNRLSYTCTRGRNPVLHDSIRQYKKHFGGLYESSADAFFAEKWGGLCQKQTEMADVVRAYYSYLLQQTYGGVYETYYFTGPVVLAACSTQFLMLFLVVAYLEEQQLAIPRIAELIAATERGVRHSRSFEKQVLELFRGKI